MTKSSLIPFNNFYKKCLNLEKTRLRIDLLRKNQKILQTDKNRIYESIFLNAIIAFEDFIEELFIGLLVDNRGLKSSRSDVSPKIIINTYKVVWDILLETQNKSYINWLPFNNTERLSLVFFQGGRPFTLLSNNQKDVLEKSVCLRNAIAHKSKHSKNKFIKQVIGNSTILKREHNPSLYLQGLFRISPDQTRYENLISQLLIIAKSLAK